MKNTILILTGKFGAGHTSATKAIAQKIAQEMPEYKVCTVDIFEYTMPSHYKTIYDGFDILVKKGSKLFNFLYEYTEKHRMPIPARKIIRIFFGKLYSLISEEEPKIIISTLPFCSQLVSAYKKGQNCKIPLVTCVTDINIHPFWINPNTDYYLVANTIGRDILIDHQVSSKRIFIVGIPVKDSFRPITSKQNKQTKTLLIMGGGVGLLPVHSKFYKMLNELDEITTVIIAGKNKKLYKKLSRRYENIKVIGFTTEVNRYMRRADLLITKGGGITIYEAIHSELPMLVFPAFLKQEEGNIEYIHRNHIGKVFPKEENTYKEMIIDLIFDESQLVQMRRNMKALKKEMDTEFLEVIMNGKEKEE